jgi:hypothetical protein
LLEQPEALQLDLEHMHGMPADVLHGMLLVISPDALAGSHGDRGGLAIFVGEFPHSTGEHVNNAIWMRMHRDFVAGLEPDIEDADLIVVQSYPVLIGCDLDRILCKNRLRQEAAEEEKKQSF